MGGVDCLLVYPYFYRQDPGQSKTPTLFPPVGLTWLHPDMRGRPMLYPPLGVMYVASSLRERGFKVKILDCTFLPSREEALRAIKAENPKSVGMYSMISLENEARRIAREVKEAGIPVIFGGPQPSAKPSSYLEGGVADFVVVGEGERTMPELLECLLQGRDPSNVRSLVYLKDGTTVWTPPRERIENLDELPLPSRDLVPLHLYAEAWRKSHGFTLTTLLTSRGCPFHCAFCDKPVFGSLYRARSPEGVVDEVELVVEGMGFDRIDFVDDTFTLDRRRVEGICSEIRRRGLEFKWSCYSRVDRIDGPLLSAMKEAGCVRVFFGVESGSQRMIDKMKKGFTTQQAHSAARAAREAEVTFAAFYIFGFPGEDYESIQATIKTAKNLSRGYSVFQIAYPLPGTELERILQGKVMREEWKRPWEVKLRFESNVPELALRVAIWKATWEIFLNRWSEGGGGLPRALGRIFEKLTDRLLITLTPHHGGSEGGKAPVGGSAN